MSERKDVVTKVDWQRVLPCSMLKSTFGVAIRIPVLFLGMAAILVAIGGSFVGQSLFIPEGDGVEATTDTPPMALASEVSSTVSECDFFTCLGRIWDGDLMGVIGDLHLKLLPTAQVSGWNVAALCLWHSILVLAVWSFFGGAISRIAVVELGRHERVTFGEAIDFGKKKFISGFMAPVFIVISMCVMALPVLAIAALARFEFGVAIAGLLWILVIVFGISITVLMLGLLFGWPLMNPAIMAEEAGDMFEAVSRSMAYTYQAPLKYLIYSVACFGIGILGYVVVINFTNAAESVIIHVSGITAGETGAATLEAAAKSHYQSDISGPAAFGSRVISSLHIAGRTMAGGFLFTFFVSAASGIYLLLRRAVDQTPLDDVYVVDEETKYALPELMEAAKAQAEADQNAVSPSPELSVTGGESDGAGEESSDATESQAPAADDVTDAAEPSDDSGDEQ
ncbi:MAG: hypothetical protein ACJZ8O_04940 [Pirellulaceae bacterium]